MLSGCNRLEQLVRLELYSFLGRRFARPANNIDVTDAVVGWSWKTPGSLIKVYIRLFVTFRILHDLSPPWLEKGKGFEPSGGEEFPLLPFPPFTLPRMDLNRQNPQSALQSLPG